MARILLLEPDMRLAATYRTALQAWGHQVSHASDAQSAIIAADSSMPEAVILELQLTAHSGIEFLYEFRSYDDWQSVPAIILSHVPPTEFADSQRLLGQRLGVRAYHYKPRTSLQMLRRSLDAVMQPA